jgi:hypothetical protein
MIAATPLTSAKEVAMTAWLFLLVPLTALLVWAWVLDRKRNKRAALASGHFDDSAARRAGVHPEYEDPGYGGGKHPDGKHPELRGGSWL